MIAPGESHLQNLLNSLEEGVGQWILRALLCLAVILLLAGSYTYTQFRGLRDAEAMRYASLGAQLAQGAGYTTQVVDPADIAYLDARDRLPATLTDMPELGRPPVFPALIALALTLRDPPRSSADGLPVFAPELQAVLPVTFLAAILTGLCVYVLALRLFHARAALLAVCAFFLSHIMLEDCLSGLPLTLEMLAVVSTVLFAHIGTRRLAAEQGVAGGWLAVLASALCCGLGILTAYALVALVPALVLVLLRSLDRGRYGVLAAWLLVVAAVVTPWLIRNAAVGGHVFGTAPYAFVADSVLYPGDTLARTLAPRVDVVLAGKAAETKLWSTLAEQYNTGLWTTGGGLLFALLLTSYLYRFVRHDVHAVHWAFALGVVCFVGAAGLVGTHDGRILHVLLPIGIVFAVGFLYVLLEQFAVDDPFAHALIVGGLLVLHALPVALTLMTQRPGIPYPPYYPPLVQQVASYADEHEVLCTDIPEAVAWYGNRAAVRLPMKLDSFYRIHDDVNPIVGLYLTPVTGGRPYIGDLVDGPSSEWLPLLNRQVPTDFPLSHGISLPRGRIDQVFIADRPRWRERR